MNLYFNTTEECWNFLMSDVYSDNLGEFRIHTNKKGIKLYLKFSNSLYTGFIYDYFIGQGIKYHKDIRRVIPKVYCGSIVAPTLLECLNKHLNNMPGEIIHENEWVIKYGKDVSNEMTADEFIYQDCKTRTQLDMYEDKVKMYKAHYGF